MLRRMLRLGLAAGPALLVGAPAAAGTVEVDYDPAVLAGGIPELGIDFGPPGVEGVLFGVLWQSSSSGAIGPGRVGWDIAIGSAALLATQPTVSFHLSGDRMVGWFGVYVPEATGSLIGSSLQLTEVVGSMFGALSCPISNAPSGGGCARLGLQPGGNRALAQAWLGPILGVLTSAQTSLVLSGTAGSIGGHPITFSLVGSEIRRATDRDGDGILDGADNCVNEPNGPLAPDGGGNSQLDVDADGFGNLCDCDFNQDGGCGQPDYSVLLTCFGELSGPGVGPAADPDCTESDMNGDGGVGQTDYSAFLSRFGGPPGP